MLIALIIAFSSGGFYVTSRMTAVVVAALLAGCANQPVAAPFSSKISHLGGPASSQAFETGAIPDVPDLKQTVASKVLSAMAFQRVTGLPTDPARLLEAE